MCSFLVLRLSFVGHMAPIAAAEFQFECVILERRKTREEAIAP
jgi:hypothetical protein